jgi:plasmid stabilization system protein ParE
VRELILLPGAETDYLIALEWYQERSAQAAAGFEAAVDVALRGILATPERWSRVDDRHYFYVLRRYPYSVIYRVETEAIVVVAVAHSSRSAIYWRTRE